MPGLYAKVTDGLRPAEATIEIKDHAGERHYFPLDRGMVNRVGNRDTIPVVVTIEDRGLGLCFVSLPVETDSGCQRLWVRRRDVVKHVVAP